MSKVIRQILEPYFGRLPELRGIPSEWAEFRCLPSTDKDGYFIDRNQQQRTTLLVSLFYDQRSSDENLLRYLLRQEIEMHRQLPLQAVHISLKICIWLLARFSNVYNIELFIDAKKANVTTDRAFDYGVFVSPGVAKSYEHLPHLSEYHQNAFTECLGPTPAQCPISEDEASEWVGNKAFLLPTPLDKLSLEDEIYLADLLSNYALRNSKIEEWIASIKKWGGEDYKTLYEYELMRGNIQGQIAALTKIGTFYPERTEHKQINLYILSGLYLEAKNVEEAYKNICNSLRNYPKESMNWECCRMYVDRFLDIILAINNKQAPQSIDSFLWVKKYLDHQPLMDKWDIKIIPKIMTASAIAGDMEAIRKFSELFRIRKKDQNDAMKS